MSVAIPKQLRSLKVALAHDYLREYGGAERVLEALHELFPDAPVYVAFTDPMVAGGHWQRFADWDIRESWLTRVPFYKQLFSPLRVWAPEYFSRFDLADYDMVISSSNAYFAKAIRVPNGVHVCYCHTPARSLYGYTTMTDWQHNPVTRLFGTIINHYLRVRDFHIAQVVNHFIANSQETARRIQKFYRRTSVVIYPPVDVPADPPLIPLSKRQYYLSIGRIAKSKHVDLTVQLATELNLPLKVVGVGKGLAYLKSIAGPSVEFLGEVTDEQLHDLYGGARALFFPAEDEDFGIVPVEAMGHGVPVIAHRSGGPLESVIEGKTGIFFDDFTIESLGNAYEKISKMNLNIKAIHSHALEFSKQHFQEVILRYLAEVVSATRKTQN